MSIHQSYGFSPEDCRRQRVRDIDTSELRILDQLRNLQAERRIILETLGVTAVLPAASLSVVPEMVILEIARSA